MDQMKLLACLLLLVCASCASPGYRIQAVPKARLSAGRCPTKHTGVFLESLEDLRQNDDPSQIGFVHVGLMNLPSPVLLEPVPKIALAAEIRNALQSCGMLASAADAFGAVRIALRDWTVEEDIGLTSEEMTVRLKYTATLTTHADRRVSSRQIVAEVKRSGLDTTDYAQELNLDVLAQSTAKLLKFIEEAGAHE